MTVLSLLTEQDRVKAILEKDFLDGSVLHDSNLTPEALETLLSYLPEENLLEIALRKNTLGQSLFYYVFQKPELSKILLSLLPEDGKIHFEEESKQEPRGPRASSF